MENQEKNKTIQEINQCIFKGLMPSEWYTQIDKWFEEYDIDAELMSAIFKECYNRDSINRKYIKTILISLNKNAVKTLNEYAIYKKNWYSKNKKTYAPDFTSDEMKLIYHALLEIQGIETLHYVEPEEMELSAMVRRKIEKIIF